MLREVPLFGALAPSLLLYLIVAILVFVPADKLVGRLGVYRLVWQSPLVRFGLFLCVFSILVLATRP